MHVTLGDTGAGRVNEDIGVAVVDASLDVSSIDPTLQGLCYLRGVPIIAFSTCVPPGRSSPYTSSTFES